MAVVAVPVMMVMMPVVMMAMHMVPVMAMVMPVMPARHPVAPLDPAPAVPDRAADVANVLDQIALGSRSKACGAR